MHALFFLMVCLFPPRAMAAEAVFDPAVFAKLVGQVSQMATYLNKFRGYSNDFDASVKAFGEDQLGIDNLEDLLKHAMETDQVFGSGNACDGNQRQPSAKTRGIVMNYGQGSDANTQAILNGVSTVYSALYDIQNIEKKYESLWNGYVLSDVTADQYFDVRNQYMQTNHCGKQLVFDEATQQLENATQMIEDVQKDLERIPGVDTSLQASLQIMNRQLARISMQNANLAKMYAKAYMEENATASAKLKDRYEDEKWNAHNDQVMDQVLIESAKQVGLDESIVQIKTPSTDDGGDSRGYSSRQSGGNGRFGSGVIGNRSPGDIPVFSYMPGAE